MNYSKIGYLLAKENEVKINNVLAEKYAPFNCEAFIESQQNIILSSSLNCELCPSFVLHSGKEIVVHMGLTLTALISQEITIELLVNDIVMLTEKKVVSGTSDIFIMDKMSLLENEENTIKVVFYAENLSATLSNFKLFLWGNGVEFMNYNDALSIGGVMLGARVVLYYLANNKMFFCEKTSNFTTLSIDDFEYKVPAKSISMCFSKTLDSNNLNVLYLYRVDSYGNLFISKYGESLAESLLETNVTQVSACKLASVYDEDMLVCVVKNGLPYYFTISFIDDVMHKNSVYVINVRGESVVKVIAVNSYSNNHFIVVRTTKNNYILNNVAENLPDCSYSNITVGFNYDVIQSSTDDIVFSD